MKDKQPVHVTLGLEPTPMERRGFVAIPMALAVALLALAVSVRGCDGDSIQRNEDGSPDAGGTTACCLDDGTVS